VVVPTDTRVRGDAARLTQALTNLVGNALVHGGGDVRLEARAHDVRVDLVVADAGGGFPPDLLARATERFVRRAGSTGAGLGLAIVDAVARAHAGSVVVANVAGGAEAGISLPVSGAARPAAPSPSGSPGRPLVPRPAP
jgi:signal transduction histidine kinase